jgi:hypothetical protein
MYGQVHYNRVLYWGRPRQGTQFRQIVVVELEQFQVRILDGEVIQTEPQFTANNPDAIYELHPGLQSALADADKEYSASMQAGWIPYA